MRLATSSIAALVLSLAVAAPGPARAAQPPAVAWSDCGGGFQCATYPVPVDYDRPDGAHLRIALIRLPASDPAHRIGSLFVNPGGPGGSGVAAVRALATSLYPADVRARFDIVGFDPRGVGASHPVRCYATNDEENANFVGAPYIPLTRAETQRLIAADRRFDAACAARTGSFLDHVSTANVARDLDRLRAAVGDAALTYDGASYGSFLGETYANMFPQHVRALVVDGVVDPDAWVREQPGELAVGIWGRGGYAQANADAMAQFLRLCDAAGTGCAFAAGPLPAAQKWTRLLTRLERRPVVAHYPGLDFYWTYSNLVQTVSEYLYAPSAYPALGQLLQPVWRAVRSAGVPPPARPAATATAAATYDNGFDALNAVACVDGDTPSSPRRIAASAAASQQAVPDFGPDWAYASVPCATWPGHDADRYTGPFTRRTAHPVLVVGNTHDAATPLANAERVARIMPRARLLTLDAVGHTSWDVGSTCVQAATAAYWLTGRLPAPGTVCRPDQQPFAAAATPAARAARAAAATLVPATPFPSSALRPARG